MDLKDGMIHGLEALKLRNLTFGGDILKKSVIKAAAKSGEILKISDVITGSYSDDLNILELNTLVMSTIIEKINKDLITAKKDLSEAQNRVREMQTPLDRGFTLKLIRAKLEEIPKLESKDILEKYKMSIRDILRRYADLGALIKVKVMGKGEVCQEIAEKNVLRHTLIEDFIRVASQFVGINILRRDLRSDALPAICDQCFFVLSKEDYQSESLITCPQCFIEMPKLMRIYDDEPDKALSCRTGDYQDLGNFEEAINKYMGLSHNHKLDTVDLIGKLDEYFTMNSLLTGDKIRDNYPKHVRIYCRELMKKALKSIGLNGMYADMQYVMNVYWGKQLKDINSLKNQLIADYKLSQPFYIKYKDPDKKSSMNVHYRLWKHLLRLGHICNKTEDFNIPITSFDYYENIWKKMCHELGWTSDN